MQAVACTNGEMTVQNILHRSPVVLDLVEHCAEVVVGALHDVSTCEVTFLDETMTHAD